MLLTTQFQGHSTSNGVSPVLHLIVHQPCRIQAPTLKSRNPGGPSRFKPNPKPSQVPRTLNPKLLRVLNRDKPSQGFKVSEALHILRFFDEPLPNAGIQNSKP